MAVTEAERSTFAAAQAISEVTLAAIRELDNQFGLEHLLQRMTELPSLIREAKDNVEALKGAVATAQADVQLEEAVLQAQISEETDARTGKPAFSNDKARAAELIKRKSASDTYQEALRVLSETEERYRSAQFDLEALVDELSVVKRAAEMQTARFRALTGGVLSG